MARRYLVVRTDKTKQAFLVRELDAGRLRQGWGYDECQDLRRIAKKVDAGKNLNDDEQDARRNRRLLDTEPDGVKPGDVQHPRRGAVIWVNLAPRVVRRLPRG